METQPIQTTETTTAKVLDIVMSKKTFANSKNAEKAGRADRGDNYTATHRLPSGRYCYQFEVRFNA